MTSVADRFKTAVDAKVAELHGQNSPTMAGRVEACADYVLNTSAGHLNEGITYLSLKDVKRLSMDAADLAKVKKTLFELAVDAAAPAPVEQEPA